MKKPVALRIVCLGISILLCSCISGENNVSEKSGGQRDNFGIFDGSGLQKIHAPGDLFWSEEFPQYQKRAAEMMRDAPPDALCLAVVRVSESEKKLFVASYENGVWKWLTPDSPYYAGGSIKKRKDTRAVQYINFNFCLMDSNGNVAWDFSDYKIDIPPENSFIFRSQCGISRDPRNQDTYVLNNYFCMFCPSGSPEWSDGADGEKSPVAGFMYSTNSGIESAFERYAYKSPRDIAVSHMLLVLDPKLIIEKAREELKGYPKNTLFVAYIEAINGDGKIEAIAPLDKDVIDAKSDDGKISISGTCRRTDLDGEYKFALNLEFLKNDSSQKTSSVTNEVFVPKGSNIEIHLSGSSSSRYSNEFDPICVVQDEVYLFTAGEKE